MWRRKWLLIVPVLASVVTSLLVVHFVPVRYESQSTLVLVHAQIPADFVPQAASRMPEDMGRFTSQVLSRTRLERVINDLGLYADDRKREIMHPFGSAIWIIGLGFLLFSARLRPYRLLGLVYLAVLLILITNRTSRSGYLAASYAPLLAAGGVAVAPWLSTPLRRAAVLAVLVIGGALTLPVAIPLLSPDRYVAYAAALGITPSTEEKKDLGRLPQFFADRQGWRAMVNQIGQAWDRLSPSERERAVVLTGNYGEAAAIEQLGRVAAMAAISGHNNYWLWGPGRASDTFIVLSRSRARQEARFVSVEDAGVIACGDCMPYENGLTIFIGRGLKLPLDQLWAQLKHFD